MIWKTENEDNRKRYTSAVGPVAFTITEDGEAFVLSVVLTVNGSAIKLYTDRCGSLEECMTAAEWHLWELSEDVQRFMAEIDAALQSNNA